MIQTWKRKRKRWTARPPIPEKWKFRSGVRWLWSATVVVGDMVLEWIQSVVPAHWLSVESFTRKLASIAASHLTEKCKTPGVLNYPTTSRSLVSLTIIPIVSSSFFLLLLLFWLKVWNSQDHDVWLKASMTRLSDMRWTIATYGNKRRFILLLYYLYLF